MSNLDTVDIGILVGLLALSAGYLFWKKNTQQPVPQKKMTLAELKASMGGGARSLISKLDSLSHDRMVVLFFGSQTGTAEDLALRTQKEISSKLNVPVVVLDLEDYDMEELKQLDKDYVCGFFMATYGEGEPTDNASNFYSWLMNGQGLGADKGDQEDEMVDEQVCENLKFFIFGLGNKTYEHYNAIARRMEKRFVQLGGKKIGERGEGDDDASMEDDFLKWLPLNIKALADYYGITIDKSSHRTQPHIPMFTMENTTVPTYRGEHTSGISRKWEKTGFLSFKEQNPIAYDAKHPYYSKYLESRPLFVNSIDSFAYNDSKIVVHSEKVKVQGSNVVIPRQCYHIELDISGSNLQYTTGDHVGIWANNPTGAVKKLAKFLKIDNLDLVVDLKPNPANKLAEAAKPSFPNPCTISDALTHYLDIGAVMKQHHLEILSKYASDPKESDVLYELSQNRELYVKLIESGQKTLTCILEEFPSVNVPVTVALTEILTKIAIRYYSISSSSVEQPDKVSVTAVVVRYALPQQHTKGEKSEKVVLKEGLATSFLERLHDHRIKNQDHEGEVIGAPPLHLPIYIRSSNFRLPKNIASPVVMVGPGTGVAPFRAFVRERFLAASKGQSVGPTWLFFGCRNEQSDYLYKQEFEEMVQKVKDHGYNIDLRIVTAFSRDGAQKVYVQHRFKEHGSTVWDMLHNSKGSFYICGDAKHMAHDVNKALEEIAASQLGSEAKNWVKKLKSENRYFEDVWS